MVDESPTFSRMFTFSQHINCLFLLYLLRLMPELLQMRGAQHLERNRKRVGRVLAFMDRPDTDQYFRRTCLSLQVAAHVNALCAQLREGEPLLVRISKGAVQHAVNEGAARLLGRLHLDPALDVAGAATLLFATCIELVLRFQQYRAWPCACWVLCRKFNPKGTCRPA